MERPLTLEWQGACLICPQEGTVTHQWKNLPPLQASTAYRATDFQRFEYFGSQLRQATDGENTAILRLHLKNSTIIDLPAEDEELRRLARVLIAAMPLNAITFLQDQPWFRQWLKERDATGQ